MKHLKLFAALCCLAAAGSAAAELTVDQALSIASSLEAGAATSSEWTVVGWVSKIKEAYSSKYQNVSFYMSDDPSKRTGENGTDFLAYRVNGPDAADVKVGDRVKVVARLMNYRGTTPETDTGGFVEILPSENGHEWVDLGLPSGLKWATCNVGTDGRLYPSGNHYAWGETKNKGSYSWDTYKYGTEDNLTKYNATDGKTVLDPEDDAASVNWGGKWRMPTIDEWEELIDNCDWTWTTDYNGQVGFIVTSNANDNGIFLPAAGYRVDDNRYGGGYLGYYWGHYWSSSLGEGLRSAWMLEFGKDSYKKSAYNRYIGKSVRPVCEVNSPITALKPTENVAIYTENGRVVCEEDFRIYDLLGRDVTRMNGSLNGIYIVKCGETAQKIVVR